MMGNFTSQRWEYNGGRFIKAYGNDSDNVIADILPSHNLDSLEEIVFNGYLIANAPEMYKLLHSVINNLHLPCHENKELINDIKECLARIDGKKKKTPIKRL